MYGFDIAVLSRKNISSAPQESLGAQSAPILEAFLMTFPGSGRSCCIFRFYANPKPSKHSRRCHGGYSGYECSGSPELWLYRDIHIYNIYVAHIRHIHVCQRVQFPNWSRMHRGGHGSSRQPLNNSRIPFRQPKR